MSALTQATREKKPAIAVTQLSRELLRQPGTKGEAPSMSSNEILSGAQAAADLLGRLIMTLCPVALAVGCIKCPVFNICPVKGIIGDYKKDAPLVAALKKKQ